MRYEDFVLHIGGRRDDTYTVRVLKSPAGEGVGRFRPPVTGSEVAAFFGRNRSVGNESRKGMVAPSFALEPPAGMGRGEVVEDRPDRDVVRRRKTRETLSGRDLGNRLFDSIFDGQVARLYDRSLGQVEGQEGVGLRIKLRLDPEALADGELEALPWELMYREETGRYLGLDRLTSIVRYLDVPRPPKPIPLPEHLRVLVVMAHPEDSGLSPLDLSAECERLELLADKHPSWEVKVEPRASVSSLRHRLSSDGPFHVVHFMGHGGFDPTSGEGLLYFEHPDGSAQAISGRDLSSKLIDFEDLGLVFLNACETANAVGSDGRDPFAGVASSLVRGGIPAVIAMQRPIADRSAIVFSEAFYGSLAGGACADEALVEGRQAIHSSRPDGIDWMIPVLFARIREGALFEAAPVVEPAHASEPNRSNRKTLVMIASLVFVLAVLGLSPLRERIFGGRPQTLALDHVFATNIEGVEGLLQRVELLPDGTMRMFFEFTNESTGHQQMGLDLSRSYLADDQGNPYEVIRSNLPFGAPELRQTLKPGETQKIWIEVPSPLDDARRFGVVLADARDSNAEHPFFEVELPKYSARLGRRSKSIVSAPGAETFDASQALVSSAKGLDARIDRVELRPGDSMRWSLAMINRTEHILGIELDPEKTVLVDNLGNVYRAQGFGRLGGTEYFEGLEIRRGLRSDPWFDFGPPKAGARTFSFRLATRKSSAVRFEDAELEIVGLSQLAGVEDPTGRPNLLPAAVEIVTNEPSLEARVVAITMTQSKKMRWWLHLRNLGSADLHLGIDLPGTYLSDQPGNRYQVLASHPAVDVHQQGWLTSLIPGAKSEPWLELESPYFEAGELTLRLAPAGSKTATFQPVRIKDLQWPEPRRPSLDQPLPGAFRVRLDQDLVMSSGDLSGLLKYVDLFRSDRMRFVFRWMNSGDRVRSGGIALDRLSLRDGQGRRYRVVGDSGAPSLLPGLAAERWFETEAPRNRATSFSLVLDGKGVKTQELKVDLGEYPKEYSQPEQIAITSFELGEGEHEIRSTLTGLRAKLISIDHLGNGRLRWHLELYNESSRTIETGFEPSTTKLIMGGDTYRLESTAVGEARTGLVLKSLAPGERWGTWLEFAGSFGGDEAFDLLLGSPDPTRFRYRLVAARLSEVASGLASASP